MKDKFERAYDELYEIYPEFNFLNRFTSSNNILFKRLNYEFREFFLKEELYIEIVKKEITYFEFDNHFPFRSDAKYFLLTSFHNMIIKPLLFQILNEDKEIKEEQIKSLIETDVKVILSNSLRFKKDEKVSGHEIMRSIDSLWGELKSTRIELWG